MTCGSASKQSGFVAIFLLLQKTSSLKKPFEKRGFHWENCTNTVQLLRKKMYRDGSTISLLPYPQTQVCEMYILQVAVVMKKYRILEKSVLCVPGSEFSTLPLHSYRYRYTAGFGFQNINATEASRSFERPSFHRDSVLLTGVSFQNPRLICIQIRILLYFSFQKQNIYWKD